MKHAFRAHNFVWDRRIELLELCCWILLLIRHAFVVSELDALGAAHWCLSIRRSDGVVLFTETILLGVVQGVLFAWFAPSGPSSGLQVLSRRYPAICISREILDFCLARFAFGARSSFLLDFGIIR